MKTLTRCAISLFVLVLALPMQMAAAHRASVPNVTVRENVSAATIAVFPSCVPLLGIRGTYWTRDGSAKAGEDYESVAGSFGLSGGAGPRTFRVPLIDDRIREGDETVRVMVLLLNNEVSFGVGAAGGCPGHPTSELIEATLTISDDETPRSRRVVTKRYQMPGDTPSAVGCNVDAFVSAGFGASGVDFPVRTGERSVDIRIEDDRHNNPVRAFVTQAPEYAPRRGVWICGSKNGIPVRAGAPVTVYLPQNLTAPVTAGSVRATFYTR